MIEELYNKIIEEEKEEKDEQMRTLLINGDNIKKFIVNFPDIDFSVYDENFIKVIPNNWEIHLEIVELLKWLKNI